MRISLKIQLLVLLLFNVYFVTFVAWYRNPTCIRFLDTYERLPSEGPQAVSVFIPFCENDFEKTAGILSRIISCSYAPLTWFWEKKGIGVFFIDEHSLQDEFEEVDR